MTDERLQEIATRSIRLSEIAPRLRRKDSRETIEWMDEWAKEACAVMILNRNKIRHLEKKAGTIAEQQEMFEYVARDYLDWGIEDPDADIENVRRVITGFVDFAKGRLCVQFR